MPRESDDCANERRCESQSDGPRKTRKKHESRVRAFSSVGLLDESARADGGCVYCCVGRRIPLPSALCRDGLGPEGRSEEHDAVLAALTQSHWFRYDAAGPPNANSAATASSVSSTSPCSIGPPPSTSIDSTRAERRLIFAPSRRQHNHAAIWAAAVKAAPG